MVVRRGLVDLLDRFAGVLRQDAVHDLLRGVDALGDFPNIGCGAADAARHEDLVDHHLRVRQDVPMPLRPGRQQDSRHARRGADAVRVHLRTAALHHIIDSLAGRHAAAARENEHLDRPGFLREMHHLLEKAGGHLVVDHILEKDRPILLQQRVVHRKRRGPGCAFSDKIR